jgi:hypothetical protein
LILMTRTKTRTDTELLLILMTHTKTRTDDFRSFFSLTTVCYQKLELVECAESDPERVHHSVSCKGLPQHLLRRLQCHEVRRRHVFLHRPQEILI